MTAAEALYRQMVSFGLTVEAHDGTLYVSPIEQITDALRARIRAHKAELLALLSGREARPASVASVASEETADATGFHHTEQSGSIGSVTKNATQTQNPAAPVASDIDRDAIAEAIAERAAIREFDGGEDRPTAEREARSAMRVYHYRLTDRPDTWLTMLAPNCDIDDARHSLVLRFGPERLIDVRERKSW